MYRVIKEFIQARYIVPNMSRETLLENQKKLYEEQIQFVKDNSPFYHDKEAIPVITKVEMMSEFDRINTRGLSLEVMMEMALDQEKNRKFDSKYKGISSGLSSGTSGQRGIYTLSREEELMWAGSALGKLLPKPFLRSYNIAFFMRANNPIYSQLNKPFFKFQYYDIFKSFTDLMLELRTQNPNIIIAPATVLWDIALFFEKHNWELPHCIKIISVAEVLDNGRILAEKFGVHHIDQVYQCTEGFLGYTCEFGEFHLNEDAILFEREWLSEDTTEKRFIPIITDLKRRVQPMIRYKMTDILIHKEGGCPCGSPLALIEGIEGRQDDYLIFQGKTVYADQVRRIFLLIEEVLWYQVKQLENGTVIIYMDTGQSQRNTIEAKLTSEFRQIGASHVIFEDFNRDRTVKLKRVIRERK